MVGIMAPIFTKVHITCPTSIHCFLPIFCIEYHLHLLVCGIPMWTFSWPPSFAGISGPMYIGGSGFLLHDVKPAMRHNATSLWKSMCEYFFFVTLADFILYNMYAFTMDALRRNHIKYFHAFLEKRPSPYCNRIWSCRSTPLMYLL